VSRYKFDRSREFIPGYKAGWGYWRSVAVQAVSEPENYHGAGFRLRADAHVRVQQPLQICLECRSKAKSVTNNLPILSVLVLVLFSFVMAVDCLVILFTITEFVFASSFKSFGL
jgi:hypothetical protein